MNLQELIAFAESDEPVNGTLSLIDLIQLAEAFDTEPGGVGGRWLLGQLKRFVSAGGCVESRWPRDADGYGRRKLGGKWVKASRYAWTVACGPIPDGLLVLHTCDNPACINLDHLFLGTNADNVADRHRKGRDARGDRSGRRLHPEAFQNVGAKRKPASYLRGSRMAGAKLDEDKVRDIRARSANGETRTAMGREYGVSAAVISAVVLRKSWRHVA